MALVSVYSVQILDHTGDVKSMPLYFPATATLAQITAFSDDFLPKLEAAIDGQIVSASVQLQIALPTLSKTEPTAGNTVHEGALLTFQAADTNFVYSVYVPSWEEAGFSDNTVLATGVYDTLQTDIEVGEGDPAVGPADRAGNDLTTFVEGRRAFRK